MAVNIRSTKKDSPTMTMAITLNDLAELLGVGIELRYKYVPSWLDETVNDYRYLASLNTTNGSSVHIDESDTYVVAQGLTRYDALGGLVKMIAGNRIRLSSEVTINVPKTIKLDNMYKALKKEESNA